MIFGRGILAAAFSSYEVPENFHFFCKGVSNSLETDLNAFDREMYELNEVLKSDNKPIYYFSSVAVDNLHSSSIYYAHKRRIENLLISSGRARIVRLPQVIGTGGNKTNLLNYFIATIRSGSPLRLNSLARRNFVKATDVARVVLSTHNIESFWRDPKEPLEVSSPFNYSPIEVAELVSQYLDMELIYTTYEHYEGIVYDASNFLSVLSDYRGMDHSEYLLSIIAGLNVTQTG